MFNTLIAQGSTEIVGIVALSAAILGASFKLAGRALDSMSKKNEANPIRLVDLPCSIHQRSIEELGKFVSELRVAVRYIGDRQAETVCDIKELLNRIPPRNCEEKERD